MDAHTTRVVTGSGGLWHGLGMRLIPRARAAIAPLSLTLLLIACTKDETTGGTGGGGGGGAVDAGTTEDAGVADMDSGVAGDAGLPMGVAPAARADMAYAFDPTTERAVMIYGDRAVPERCSFPPSDFVDSVFAFDTRSERWTPIEVSGAAPQARARPLAVWHTGSSRALMFGGRFRAGTMGDYTLFSDVWAFDPNAGTWELLNNDVAPDAPRARTNFALEMDGDRMLLHGGSTSPSGVNLNCQSDTWAFDTQSNTWSVIGAGGTQPPIRCYHAMAIDAQRRHLYVFGGGGNGAFQGPFFDDLWVLDLDAGTWSQIPKRGAWPPARIRPTLSYHASGDRLVLFGGHDNGFGSMGDIGVKNDLWTFNLSTRTWELQIQGDVFSERIVDNCSPPVNFTDPDLASPERRQSHMFFIHGDKGFLYGGKTDCGIANDTWVIDLTTFGWRQISESFRGMTCYRSGQDCSSPDARYCG